MKELIMRKTIYLVGIFLILQYFAVVACSAIDTQQSLRDRITQATARRDWPTAEALCRQAMTSDQGDEFILGNLSISLCRQNRPEEGFSFASTNYQLNPGPWSLTQYADAAADMGRFDIARQAAKTLETLRPQWYDAASAAQAVINRVSILTYRFIWKYTGTRDLTIPIPQQDANVQTSVTCELSGVTKWEYRQTNDGVRYIYAVPIKGQEVIVTAVVRMTPFSWRPFLAQAIKAKPLIDHKLLGKTTEQDRVSVDPNSMAVNKMAEILIGKTQVETADNIIRWISDNIPWDDVWGTVTAEECLRLRKGSCSPRTLAGIALLRHAGIPAHAIRGISGIGPNAKGSGHTIPRFYLDGLGWVDCDFKGPLSQQTASLSFLRMHYRYTGDNTLGDAPACTIELIAKEL
jgi:hypothetical protein